VEPVPVPATPPPQVAVATPPPEKPREPLVPVAPPPPDRPLAVVQVPQVIPPPAPVRPREYITGPARPSPITPILGGGDPDEPVATATSEDWRSFVASGDNYMRFRKTDDAIEAYEAAIEAAVANPKSVPPNEFSRVCMSLGALQIQNGSPAEARRTLIQGRQFLIRNKGAAGAIGQIEGMLKKLPRD
jgi:hypothetical protein